MASIMARASCDECGVLFETLSDLQNHVRSWCYGGSDKKRPRLSHKALRIKKMTILPLSTWLIRLKKKQKNDLKHMFRNTKQIAKEEDEMVTLPGDQHIMY